MSCRTVTSSAALLTIKGVQHQKGARPTGGANGEAPAQRGRRSRACLPIPTSPSRTRSCPPARRRRSCAAAGAGRSRRRARTRAGGAPTVRAGCGGPRDLGARRGGSGPRREQACDSGGRAGAVVGDQVLGDGDVVLEGDQLLLPELLQRGLLRAGRARPVRGMSHLEISLLAIKVGTERGGQRKVIERGQVDCELSDFTRTRAPGRGMSVSDGK